jgi:hypothetical protein
MRLSATVAWAVAIAMTPSAVAGNAETAVCVENASDDELLFVAEADGGERKVRTLSVGETLCADAPNTGGNGAVRVFENENALEGCSRIAVAGKPERLIGYVAFDNCTWTKP